MHPKELVKAGRLNDARHELTGLLKAAPADLAARTLLVQVLLFCGEWAKAEKHLGVIASQDSRSETTVQVYKNLMKAEKERLEVYGLKQPAAFMPQPPPYAGDYLKAFAKLIKNEIEEAQALFAKVETAYPGFSGTLNGQEFEYFRDTDAFVSHAFEALVHDEYVWIPLDSVQSVSISRPATLLDTLWITGRVETWDGSVIGCYFPVLYAGSFDHGDDRVKMGRMTDWTHIGGEFSRARGQHVFAADEREVGILEVEELVFNRPRSGETK